jgi:hypothetical protein
MGLGNVTDIEGGMEGWLSSGLPVVPFTKRDLRALLQPAQRPARKRPAAAVR